MTPRIYAWCILSPLLAFAAGVIAVDCAPRAKVLPTYREVALKTAVVLAWDAWLQRELWECRGSVFL